MPGTYNHVIIVDIGHLDIEKISLPGEFQADADEINQELEEIENTLYQVTPQMTQVIGERSQQLQRNSLSSYDSIVTGALADSIDIQGGGFSVYVGTNIFYAEYVNDGRGPVHAKNKKCLHVVTKNGVEVFAKSVGPAAPRPYLDDSSEALSGEIEEIVGDFLEVL